MSDIFTSAVGAKAQGSGLTLAHWCAAAGCFDLALKLCSLGADVNAKDAAGESPLHCACRSQNAAMIKLYISNGGDLFQKNAEGVSPYQLLAEDLREEIASFYRRVRSDADAQAELGLTETFCR